MIHCDVSGLLFSIGVAFSTLVYVVHDCWRCLFLYSLLALSPEDVLPSVYLCTNKIAADHENVVS